MMKKEEYVRRHRELLRAYFADTTAEGRMVKYYQLKEAEYVLMNVFGMAKADVMNIYEKEYWHREDTPKTARRVRA